MKRILFLFTVIFLTTSCENDLENKTFGTFSSDTFFQSESDARAAVNAMYTGLLEGDTWSAGWGTALNSFRVQSSVTTDELVCYWGFVWNNFNALQFTPDDYYETSHYNILMPYISQITLNIDKISKINMDKSKRQEYIGELKALRGYYSQILYLYYGPVPTQLDPSEVNNPTASFKPRPTKEKMVELIIKDYEDAIQVLPDRYVGPDWGRFSKSAVLTALMKLYMQEKRWSEAVEIGHQIKAMGFKLIPNYSDNFSYNSKGGNSEIILTIVCSPTSPRNVNLWYPHALPVDYYEPTGVPITKWGGYRMPWNTYNKFDSTDKRLSVLLRRYPIGRDLNGVLQFKDALKNGDIGAVMVKFGPDPTKVSPQNSGVDMPVFRYADIELLLAEALNEVNGSPTAEAYDLINDVRSRAGLLNLNSGLSKPQFLEAIQNERLFELWAEGVRRDDLIRWGLYIKRAIDDGYFQNDDHAILYPIPRTVVNQSKGIILQNPGYF